VVVAMTAAQEDVTADRAQRRTLVRRFEPNERFGHWWVAFWFAITVLSGGALGDDGGSSLSAGLGLHLFSAGALVAGLVLLPILPGRRALWRTLRMLLWPASTNATRRGKFNIGQTFAAYAFAALLIAIYSTGLAALAAHSEDGGPHGAVVALTLLVLAGHVFLAVVYPSTRPSLRGMVTGWVDRKWALRHYPGWVADVDELSGTPGGR
jgi:cytochrome b subunit of formate dehydrogenase